MENYYYIGTDDFTLMDFALKFKQNTYDKNRLFKLDNNNFICNNTKETSSVVIYDNEIYHLRCNIINENKNILCYYKEV